MVFAVCLPREGVNDKCNKTSKKAETTVGLWVGWEGWLWRPGPWMTYWGTLGLLRFFGWRTTWHWSPEGGRDCGRETLSECLGPRMGAVAVEMERKVCVTERPVGVAEEHEKVVQGYSWGLGTKNPERTKTDVSVEVIDLASTVLLRCLLDFPVQSSLRQLEISSGV